MEAVLQLSAPIWGLMLGTLLFARVGTWVQAIVTALKAAGADRRALPLVALLHSGPWLFAAVAYWAYHTLSRPHAPAWQWFFGAVVIALLAWLAVSIYLHVRGG